MTFRGLVDKLWNNTACKDWGNLGPKIRLHKRKRRLENNLNTGHWGKWPEVVTGYTKAVYNEVGIEP